MALHFVVAATHDVSAVNDRNPSTTITVTGVPLVAPEANTSSQHLRLLQGTTAPGGRQMLPLVPVNSSSCLHLVGIKWLPSVLATESDSLTQQHLLIMHP